MSRLQPRLKALATSNVSSQFASASKEHLSRPQTPVARQSARLSSADPLSERATLFLIRRTLCSQLGEKVRSTPAPIDEILPPLTSSNEVDLQLYAFITIIIREFVHTWYTKITPDHVFVDEVVKIIAHCTRGLEQRLRKVDLESLLFDELPDLLEVHVQGMWMPWQDYCVSDFDRILQHIEHLTTLYTLPLSSQTHDRSIIRYGLFQHWHQFRMEETHTLCRNRFRMKRRTGNYWSKVSWPSFCPQKTWKTIA